MIVETSRLERIGIDRIVLNNFKVENFLELEKKKIIKQGETIERFECNDNNYSLTYSMIKNESGEYNIATLEFNPNKIKEGHNLYNSTVKDVKISLDKIGIAVKMKLKSKVKNYNKLNIISFSLACTYLLLEHAT